MKQIPLTQGKYALVDDNMFEELSKYKWYFKNDTKGGYAARNEYSDGKQTTIRMHRVILNTPKEKITDHKNRNKLDNRRENLRTCTRSENRMNASKRLDNTSGFKGVYWHNQTEKWESRISARGKSFSLGLFDKKIEAAKKYNEAAKKYHKEFACLNPIGT